MWCLHSRCRRFYKDAREYKVMIKVRSLIGGFVVALVVVFGVGVSAAEASAAPAGTAAGAVKSVRAAVPSPVERGMCDVLAQLPGYSYRYQGATVRVPSGKALLKELSADGVKGSARARACKALVGEYAAHN